MQLILLLACSGGLDEERYAEALAKAACDYEESCAATEFYSFFDTQDDCRADVREMLDEEVDDMDDNDCDFDEDSAASCIEAYDASCQDVGAAGESHFLDCHAIWSCDAA